MVLLLLELFAELLLLFAFRGEPAALSASLSRRFLDDEFIVVLFPFAAAFVSNVIPLLFEDDDDDEEPFGRRSLFEEEEEEEEENIYIVNSIKFGISS